MLSCENTVMGAIVQPLARQAVSYLRDLGLPATEAGKPRGKALPYHFADAFELLQLDIASQPVLLVIDEDAGRSPGEAEQLMRKIRGYVDAITVYVTGALNSYDRKRLIERRVAFLVPGNQLYIPDLGVDLREHFRRPIDRQPLSPSAQAILIAALLHPDWTSDLTATEIAAKFDYSPMTASRAARELVAGGLVELHKAASGQMLRLINAPKDTWALALPLLRSPVQRVAYAKLFAYQPPGGLGDIVSAGLYALARHTMLAHEGPKVFACSRDAWKGWKEWAQVLPHADDNADEVQIWSYPPTLKRDAHGASRASEVDPLSLYLSLRDMDDPRVQLALEELMEQVWP